MRGQSQERGDAKPFLHQSGRWAKKVNGKLFYLGYVRDDPDGDKAWQRWLDVREEVRAGRTPRRPGDRGVTVAELVNEFLNAKRLLVESGDITGRTHADLTETMKRLTAGLGRSRLAVELKPGDFAVLRSQLAARYGAERLKCEITRCKAAFHWGHKNGVLPTLPTFGTAFDQPAMRSIRLARAERGQRIFKPAELRRILKKADAQLRACTLLGLNCAFGCADLSTLTVETMTTAIADGWLSVPRHKTGASRKCWLWPETVKAVSAALASRPRPAKPEHDHLALLSPEGLPWLSADGRSDRLGKAFARLLDDCGLGDKELSFYRLRHTWRTVADETLDAGACDLVMGHIAAGMGARYRQGIGDDRVRRACEHVHQWLFGEQAEGAEGKPGRKLRVVNAG